MSNTNFNKAIKSLIDFEDNLSSTLKRVIEYNKGNTQDEGISELAKKIKPHIGEVEDLVIAAKDIINTYSRPIDKNNADEALSIILKDIFSDNNIETLIKGLKNIKEESISEGRKLNRQDINKRLADVFDKIPSIETALKKSADSSVNKDAKSVITKMPKSAEFHKTTPKHARKHIGGSNNPNSSDVKTSKAALKAIENAAKKNGGRIVRGYGKDKNKLYFVPNEEQTKKTKSGTEYVDKKLAEKFIEIEYLPVKNGGFIHNGNEKSAGQVPYIDNNGNVRGIPLPQMYLNQIADNADNIFKEFKSDPGLAKWKANTIKSESLSIASVRSTNKAEIDKETFGTNSEVQKLFKDNNLYLKHFIDQLFNRSKKLKSESFKEYGWTGERIRTQIVRAIYIKALNISDELKSELFKTSDMADLVYSGAWDEVEPLLDKLVENFKPEFGPNSEDSISHQVIGMISNDEAFFGAELTPLLRKVIQTAKVAKKANNPIGGIKNTLKGSSSALNQEDNQHQRHAVYGTNDKVINIAHKNLLEKTKEKINTISNKIETLKNKKFEGENSKEQKKLNKKEIDNLKIDLKKQEGLLRSLGTNAPSVDDDMSMIVDDDVNRNDFESYVNKTVDISNSVIDERLKIKEKNISDTNAEIEVLKKELEVSELAHENAIRFGFYSDEEEEEDAKNNISHIKKIINKKKEEVGKWISAITDEHGNENLSKKRDEIIKDILEEEHGHLYQRERSEDVYSERDNSSGITSVLFRHASGVDKNRKYGIGNRRTQVIPIARELAEEIIRVQYGLPSDFDLSSYEMSAFVGDKNIGYNDLASSINEQLPNIIKLYQDKFGINRDSKGWEEGFIDWVKNSDSPGAKQLASLLKIDKTGGIKPSSKMRSAGPRVIKQAFKALFGSSSLATKLVENENERFLLDTKYTPINVIEENPIDTTKNAKVNKQIRESVLNMGGVTGMSEYASDLARAMMPTEETLGEYNQAVDAIDEAFKMSFASGKDMDKTIDPNTKKDTAISIGPGPQYDINLLDVVRELNESGSIYDEDGKVRDVEAIEKLLWSKVETIKKEQGNEHKKFAYLDVSNADVSASDYNNNNYDINRVYLPDVKLKQNDDGTFVLPQGSPELRALMGAIVDFANIGPKDVNSKSRITRSVGNFFASQENAKNRGFYYELGNKNTVAGSQRMHGRAVNISELANSKGLRSNINKVGFQTNRNTFLENLRKKTSEFGNNAAKIEYMQNFLQELTFGEDELKVDNTGTDDKAVELFENRIADYITLDSEKFNKLQGWMKDRGISADSVERIRGMSAHHLRWPPTNGLDFRGMQWFINEDANLADDEFFGAFVQRLASNQDFDSDTISAIIDPLTFNNPDDARKFSNNQMEIWLRAAPRLISDKIKEIEEVEENKANDEDVLKDAFSLIKNKDLYGLSELNAKHFKEAVGQTSNMAYGIGKIIESAGLGTIGIDDTYESQLNAANAMITRNMLEALEQRMISAKHATKLAVKQDGVGNGLSDAEAEEEANKKIAELFSAADIAFNTVKKTGDIGKLYSKMQDLGILGKEEDQVLDSRIGAITMSAIQGFTHGDEVLKTILGDQYGDIINNPEKYGTFTGDVVGRAVSSTQNAINQSPHNVANYNQVRYNRTGTSSEKDGFGTMMALAAHYGPRVAENTEKVNDLAEATKKLEDAIYSEAEAEKYKTVIAQKEGDQYDSNINKLKKLKDATSQLNKANEIAKDVAKGENVYNPSVTTMIRKAFGGNEFPDLSGFRSSRDLTTNKYGGSELVDVYGEDLYKKYSNLDQSIIFGNIAHGVKEAIGAAQSLGFTGSSYKDMVDWINTNRSNNAEIQKLWDEFNKEEDPETHERGIFDLMKNSEEEIKKMSLDKDDFNKRKNSAILNAVVAGETLYNASSTRAGDSGFVESEVKLAGVLGHAQHGRADTIVGSFGGKRWDSDLQKFIDDENVSNIEVQDIKTDTKTGLTAKQAIQPVLYAYYLQQARELMLDKDGNIKEAFRKKDSNGGFLTGKNGEFLVDTESFKNDPSNPLSRIGMDIDDKLIDQLSRKNVEITAAIQKFNANTGAFETYRASLRDLLGNKKIVEMISQVSNSGNFDTDIIDPENYHFLTDAFSSSSIAGESGHAKNFVSSSEFSGEKQKDAVDALNKSLEKEYELKIKIAKLKNTQAFVDTDSKEYEYYQTQIDDLNRQVEIAESETKDAEKLVTGRGSKKLKNSLRQSYEGKLNLATLSEEEIQKKKEEEATKALNEALKEEYRLKLKIAELRAKKELSIDEKEKENIDKIISLENSNLTKAEAARKAAEDKVTDKDYKNNILSAKEAEHQLEVQKLMERLTKGIGGVAGKKGLFSDFGKQLKGYFVNMFSAYRIIGKITQELKKCVQIAKELDKAATNIRIVTGMSGKEVDSLMKKYTGLAKELGVTTQVVAQAGQEWMRQGYNAEEANDLIISSTKLSKLGMMDMNNATKVLTSTMKGFKLEASEAGKIVDKLTKLDMNYATTAADIGEAMSRTAAIANQMGVSLDETAAMVTTIMDITQQSAEMTGTAIRTILSRYGNVKSGSFVSMLTDGEDLDKINDIEKVLSVLGIEIRKSSLEMRDVGDVLDELALKWTTLSDVEKNAVATAFAGTRQRNQFIVLMDNWKQVEEATDMAANAAGTADEKYGAYMDSIEARLNKLQTAWEEFTQKLGASSFVKGAVSALTFLVENLDKILTLLGSISAYLMAKKLWANIGKLGGIFNGLSTIGFKRGAADAAANPNSSVLSRIFGTTQKGFTNVVNKLEEVKQAVLGNNREALGSQSVVDSMTVGDRSVLYKQNKETIKQNNAEIKKLNKSIKENKAPTEFDPRVGYKNYYQSKNDEIKAQNTALRGGYGAYDVGNGKIVTMRKGSDGNMMYYATTMQNGKPQTQKIDSNSADAQNAQAQKKTQTSQKLAGAAAMGIMAGATFDTNTMNDTGAALGFSYGKGGTTIDDVESTKAEDFLYKTSHGIGSAALSMIPVVGPIISAVFGPMLSDLFHGLIKWAVHRDEINRKERVRVAKENLEALKKIEDATVEVESAIFNINDASSMSAAKESVDKLINTLLDDGENRKKIMNELGAKFGFAVDEFGNTMMTTADLEEILLYGTDKEKSIATNTINQITNSESATEKYKSQEDDRFKNEEKLEESIGKSTDSVHTGYSSTDTSTKGAIMDSLGLYSKEIITHSDGNGGTTYETKRSIVGENAEAIEKNAETAILKMRKIVEDGEFNGKKLTQAEIDAVNAEIESLEAAVKGIDEYSAETEKLNKELHGLELEDAFRSSGLSMWNAVDIANSSLETVIQTFANNLELTGVATRDATGMITNEARRQIETYLRSNEQFSSLFNTSSKTLNEIISNVSKQNELVSKTGAKSFDELKDAFDRADTEKIKEFSDAAGIAAEELMGLVYQSDTSQLSSFARALNMTTDEVLALQDKLGSISLSDLIKTPAETREAFNELAGIFSEISNKGSATGETLEKLNSKYFNLYNKYDELGNVISTGSENLIENLRERLFGDANSSGTQAFLYQNSTFQELKGNSDMYKSYLANLQNSNIWDQLTEDQKKAFTGANTLSDVIHLFNSNSGNGKELQNTLSSFLDGLNLNNDYYTELQNKLVEWQKHDNQVTIDGLQSQIDALDEINEEREREIELIKAKDALENAKKEKKRVYRAGVGWTYEADQEKISEAKDKLDEVKREIDKENLQYQIDLLEKQNSMLDNMAKNEELKALKAVFDEYNTYMKNKFGKEVTSGFSEIIDLAESDRTMTWSTYVENMGTEQAVGEQVDITNMISKANDIAYLDSVLAGMTNGLSGEELTKMLHSEEYISRQTARKNAYNSFLGSVSNLKASGASEDTINTYLSSGLESKYQNDNYNTVGAYTATKYDGAINDEYYYLKSGFGTKDGQTDVENYGENQYLKLVPQGKYTDNDITAAMKLLSDEPDKVRMDYYDEASKTWKALPDDASVINGLPNGTIIHAGTSKVESSSDPGHGYAIKDGSAWENMTASVENFAKGTFGLDKAVMAMINELGTEGIVTPQGTLTALPSKTGVVPADLTKNLYDLGEVAPNLIKRLGSGQTLHTNSSSNLEDNSMNVENLYATFETDEGFDFEKLLISARQYIKNTKGTR